MTYKIGTRVKQVRGANIGSTGLVVAGPNSAGRYPSGVEDMCVLNDKPWISSLGFDRPAGTISCTDSRLWVPIIPDGHRAGQSDLCKPLDRLLTRLKGVEA